MRLVPGQGELVRFHLSKKERDVFQAVLNAYPAIPAGHQRLSRTMIGEGADENQSLLDEALAAQRAENQARLRGFMDEPERWTQMKSGWRLNLKPGDAEWLLQVINNVRVGCWVRLGSPDFEAGEKVDWSEETAPLIWLMECAGQFESVLLQAFGHD